jgi:hypothetical protein
VVDQDGQSRVRDRAVVLEVVSLGLHAERD